MTNEPDKNLDKDLPSGLYIIATPIGNMGDMSLRAIETLRKVDVIACEDTRESGKLTSFYDIKAQKLPYHDHNADEIRPKLIEMIKAGSRVALISDAGMPLISDPGYKLVSNCTDAGLLVTCVPGASASLTGLVLSGLPTDKFMFAGFLPPKSSARKSALSDVKDVPATLVFYETAPRILESLRDMGEVLGNRQAAVARELTKKFEEVKRGTLDDLASYYAENGDPRGEIVVVVAAPSQGAAGDWNDSAIDALLMKMMDEDGMSLKDAAAFVAAKSGRKKSDVYQQALLLKNKK